MGPEACLSFTARVAGEGVRILGGGNGDSAWQGQEQPADEKGQNLALSTYNGLAQLIVEGKNPSLQIEIVTPNN